MDDTTPDAVQRPHEDDSASDNTGDNVLDSLPLNEYDALINSPHGAPSASKGGRNFAWTMPESLAAVHAREATNNDTQRRDKVSRTRDCSDRFVPALRALKAADADCVGGNSILGACILHMHVHMHMHTIRAYTYRQHSGV